MIKAVNISRNFGGNGLRSTDISLEKGGFIGVSGASGCGKSTLLNIITGMLRPDSGTVIIGGEDIFKLSSAARTALRAGKIGYIMQGSVLLGELTVLENIILPARIAGRSPDREKAEKLCRKLGIDNVINSYPSDISGGEYRRTMLARILFADTPILIADEPTSNLDEESASIVRSMIKEVHDKGVSIIAATHDSELLSLADNVIQLQPLR